MTNFPTSLDTALTFPYQRPHGAQGPDGVATNGGDLLEACRDAIIALQAAVGINGADRRLRTARSTIFNIDNGAGVTRDDVMNFPYAITIRAVRRIYVGDATAGTVAAATTKLGTALAGAEIVAADTCTDGATIGTVEDLTIVDGAVAADESVFIRHTGIATTAAGEYVVEIDYTID